MEDDKPNNAHSWANIVKTSRPNTPRTTTNPETVNFGVASNREPIYEAKEKLHNHHDAPNTIPRFNAEGQLVQAVVPGIVAPTVAEFDGLVASMKETIFLLHKDISQRSLDLISAKASLAGKDSQIKHLENIIRELKKELGAVTATDNGTHYEIIRLRLENASLRESVHTGIINVAQVYGPGSLQHFEDIGTKGVEAEEKRVDDSVNHHQKVEQVPYADPAPAFSSGNGRSNGRQGESKATHKRVHFKQGPPEGTIPSSQVFRPTNLAVITEVDTITRDDLDRPDSNKTAVDSSAHPIDVEQSTEGVPIVRLPPPINKTVAGSKAAMNAGTKARDSSKKPASVCSPIANTSRATQDTSKSSDRDDGWTQVQTKRVSSKDKWKKRQAAKKQAAKKRASEEKAFKKKVTDVTTAVSPGQSMSPGTKPSTKAKVALSSGHKPKPIKRPHGTVIGSASKFSQKPNPQKDQSAKEDERVTAVVTEVPVNEAVEPKPWPHAQGQTQPVSLAAD
ncbi:uncharacterized protein F4807DRAFT_463301 [Annulohypoxylon truncatum]|uniref:uncharacterized protein n=1 Tax=Annulohypoxylon truncatum TaxID=327061 RepID=UPI0020089E90|nr:uncharacterized protein F4807DRAFT_463301 [Annulohypoxylon truncatum]KAI1206903.1 hypothetical protein F4807DRAFT_463301 [Annulohypoxylon truncatum]